MENHLQIGKRMKLFFEHSDSPGSILWAPEGTQVVTDLQEYLATELNQQGYLNIKTPQLYKCRMWDKTGHLGKYKDNIFMLNDNNPDAGPDDKLGLKPMNCHGHAEMFRFMCQSERQLPMRFMEYCPLHRNEPQQSLTGLFRLHQFTQDDGHIFCTMKQIRSEVKSIIKLMIKFYKLFGLRFSATVSTRPEQSIGDDQSWEIAETILKECIVDLDPDFKIGVGNGAFYGPKIDVFIADNQNRSWQCGTIQLDFNMGIQLDLKYAKIGQDNQGEYGVPIVIHRAIMGSVERFVGILLEHTQGCLPYWLSSRQIYITIVSSPGQNCDPKLYEYVKHIQMCFRDNVVVVNLDTSETVGARVADAIEKGYHYIFVIGKNEMERNEICYRCRENSYNNVKGSIKDVFDKIKQEYAFTEEPVEKTEK